MSVSGKFRQLGADTFWYGLTSALSKSLALVLLPVYARQLTPGEFGIFDLAMVAVTVLSLAMGLELHGALKRYFYQGGADQLTRLVSTLYLAVAVIGSSLTLLTGALLLIFWAGGALDSATTAVLLLAAGAALLKAVLALSEVQLRMERRVGHFAVVQLTNIFVSAGGSLYFLLVLDWGATGIVLGYVFGSAVAAGAATWWVRERIRLNFDWPLFKRAWSYSAPLVPAVASGYLRRFGDRFVILAFLPVASLGVYALGFRIAMIPMLFTTAFQMGWSPLAVSLIGDPDQEDIYCSALRYYTLLVGGLGMVVVAFVPELVAILGGAQYESAIPVVGWIVGAVVLQGAGTFVTVGAMVAEKTSIHLTGSVVAGGASIAFMVAFVPFLGIEGAAIGAFVGTLLGRIVTYSLSQRAYRLRYAGKRISGIIGLFVLMQGVLFPLVHTAEGSTIALRFFVLVVCLCCVGMILLDARDRRKLRALVIKR